MLTIFELASSRELNMLARIFFPFLLATGCIWYVDAHPITRNYAITATGQSKCTLYDRIAGVAEVDCAGSGQDASQVYNQQSFCSHGDETVTDMVTGLMWTVDAWPKEHDEAVADLNGFELGGYTDWRLPTIKELYSLLHFEGETGMDETDQIPYLDLDHFKYYNGVTIGQRYIDGQFWSSNQYTGNLMGSTSQSGCHFGVNFADGRIKCYGGVHWTRYVRGHTSYGVNSFTDTGVNTIDDSATGLQWTKFDSGYYGAGASGDGTMDWNEAIAFCDGLNEGGFDDWRLPNAHELQSIVDYSRSPFATDSPALDPIFEATMIQSEVMEDDWGWYWTSTTHYDGLPLGSAAVYVAFGRATGYFNTSADSTLRPMDVHGAGAQRSEDKVGPIPAPGYRGPQNDYLRIYNFARCVREYSAPSPDAPASCVVTPVEDKKPNFIIIQPDDLEFFEAWTPPAHFSDQKKYVIEYPELSDLPNINRLREDGVQMTQAYAASPVCGTSRYSTVTGRQPSRSSYGRDQNFADGIRDVTIPTTKLADTPSVDDGDDCSANNLAQLFKANNFSTGVVGKWHLSKIGQDLLNYTSLQETVKGCGFGYADGLYPENLEGNWTIDENHNMEYITSKAIEFIEMSVAAEKPFFLYFNPTAPHSSGNVSEALTTYDCSDTPDPNHVGEPYIPFGMTQGGNLTCREYRDTVLARAPDATDNNALGSIWVDDAIGSLIMTLEHYGELDNTFILFQQDHGNEGKGSLFEPGIRIAQFAHYPAEIRGGTTFDGMVSTIDIGPTVADYAGFDESSPGFYRMDGTSWKQMVDFELETWVNERCLYFELDYDRAVRCGCFKYIHIDSLDNNSSTWIVSNYTGPPLDFWNVYDLCNYEEEYITSPANTPEADGSVDGTETIVAELQAVEQCFADMTDPSNDPVVYDYDACSYEIQSTLAVRTESPSETPVECLTCDRAAVGDGIVMFLVNSATGTCESGCFEETARNFKENQGYTCSLLPECVTETPSAAPSPVFCDQTCFQPLKDTYGILMKLEDETAGTCEIGCFNATIDVQERQMEGGWVCGACDSASPTNAPTKAPCTSTCTTGAGESGYKMYLFDPFINGCDHGSRDYACTLEESIENRWKQGYECGVCSDATEPSAQPSSPPTGPADSPSTIPSTVPTVTASSSPTITASATPTVEPSNRPTDAASSSPTVTASATPTAEPSNRPTVTASSSPTVTESDAPTAEPSNNPTVTASTSPTVTASSAPTAEPSNSPTVTASSSPTVTESGAPTAEPSNNPTVTASFSPTVTASSAPTAEPSHSPSVSASAFPTATPSTSPSDPNLFVAYEEGQIVSVGITLGGIRNSLNRRNERIYERELCQHFTRHARQQTPGNNDLSVNTMVCELTGQTDIGTSLETTVRLSYYYTCSADPCPFTDYGGAATLVSNFFADSAAVDAMEADIGSVRGWAGITNARIGGISMISNSLTSASVTSCPENTARGACNNSSGCSWNNQASMCVADSTVRRNLREAPL